VSPDVDGLFGSFWELDNHVLPKIACAPWGTCLLVYHDGIGGLLSGIQEFQVFGDEFDETGNTSRWTSTVP
jgi:hypothetical protein